MKSLLFVVIVIAAMGIVSCDFSDEPTPSTEPTLNPTPDPTPAPSSTPEGIGPEGYSVTINNTVINTSNQVDFSFSLIDAEVGTTSNYQVDDTNGSTTAVTGFFTVVTGTDTQSGIDVSGLDDDTLTLTVYLVDIDLNEGDDVTDDVLKDATIPAGYGVTVDNSVINSGYVGNLSFTLSSGEVGATCYYSIDDINGGTTAVSGSFTVVTSTDNHAGIDVSSLDDDTLTLTIYLEDAAGNQGSSALDTVAKDATAPVAGGGGTLSTSNTTPSSIDLTWAAGSDNISASGNLMYKVVWSHSNNINSVADAESNGSLLQDWGATSPVTANDLIQDTTYYFNVLLRDEAGNKITYSTVSEATDPL